MRTWHLRKAGQLFGPGQDSPAACPRLSNRLAWLSIMRIHCHVARTTKRGVHSGLLGKIHHVGTLALGVFQRHCARVQEGKYEGGISYASKISLVGGKQGRYIQRGTPSIESISTRGLLLSTLEFSNRVRLPPLRGNVAKHARRSTCHARCQRCWSLPLPTESA